MYRFILALHSAQQSQRSRAPAEICTQQQNLTPPSRTSAPSQPHLRTLGVASEEAAVKSLQVGRVRLESASSPTGVAVLNPSRGERTLSLLSFVRACSAAEQDGVPLYAPACELTSRRLVGSAGNARYRHVLPKPAPVERTAREEGERPAEREVIRAVSQRPFAVRMKNMSQVPPPCVSKSAQGCAASLVRSAAEKPSLSVARSSKKSLSRSAQQRRASSSVAT
mgnify:FL=1